MLHWCLCRLHLLFPLYLQGLSIYQTKTLINYSMIIPAAWTRLVIANLKINSFIIILVVEAKLTHSWAPGLGTFTVCTSQIPIIFLKSRWVTRLISQSPGPQTYVGTLRFHSNWKKKKKIAPEKMSSKIVFFQYSTSSFSTIVKSK